mgnify:CR=1 FL=1
MECVTRAKGHSLKKSTKAASNLDARTSKVPYPLSHGAVSLTASGLDLAIKEEVFAGSVVEQVCVLFDGRNLIFSYCRVSHCHPVCLGLCHSATKPLPLCSTPLPWCQLG